jgi:type VI secretion system protein ImpM
MGFEPGMQCGLYGKVPSKRDFIAPRAPRSFLDVWEPWLQGGMSASRQRLGDEWQAIFLKAPIWRFWLGEELCGTSVAGAFMPSLDGVGRYFPLTVFGCADEGTAIPPPELDAQDSWFAAIEDFLLATLDQGVTFEAVAAELDRLSAPQIAAAFSPQHDLVALPEGMVAAIPRGESFSAAFARMRETGHAKAYASATFWWTIGGEGYPPFAVSGRRMPDPFLFSDMLSGRFAFGFE